MLRPRHFFFNGKNYTDEVEGAIVDFSKLFKTKIKVTFETVREDIPGLSVVFDLSPRIIIKDDDGKSHQKENADIKCYAREKDNTMYFLVSDYINWGWGYKYNIETKCGTRLNINSPYHEHFNSVELFLLNHVPTVL